MKIKQLLKWMTIIAVIIGGAIAIPKLYAATQIIEGIYTDSDGVRWEYSYDSSDENSDVSVAFFDKPDEITKVKVPSVPDMVDKSGNRIIPEGHEVVQVVSRFDIIGEKPNDCNTAVNEINLENTLNVESLSPMLDTSVDTKVILPSTGIYLQEGVFIDATVDITNLENVIYIGNKCFYNTKFKNPDISLKKLESLGIYSFSQSNIKTLYIDMPSVTAYSFTDCTELSSVELGDNVTTLGSNLFANDYNLKTINYNNVTQVDNCCFQNCKSLTTSLNDTKIAVIGAQAYENCISMTGDLVMPENVKELNWREFANTKINSVKLNNIQAIGGQVFADNENLSSIDFGKVTSLGWQAFGNCKKLTSLYLTESVQKIDVQTFINCSLSTVDLNKVSVLEYEAFVDNNIEEVILPRSIEKIGYGIFDNNPLKTITVCYDTCKKDISMLGNVAGNRANNVENVEFVAPYVDDGGSEEEVKESTQKISKFTTELVSNPSVIFKVQIPTQNYEDYTSNDGVHNSQLKNSKLRRYVYKLSQYYDDDTEVYITATASDKDGKNTKNIYTCIGTADYDRDGYSFVGLNSCSDEDEDADYNTYYNSYTFSTNTPAFMAGWSEKQEFRKLEIDGTIYIEPQPGKGMNWKNSGYNIDKGSMNLYIKLKNTEPTKVEDFKVTGGNIEKTLTASDISEYQKGRSTYTINAINTTLFGPYTIDFSNLGIDLSKVTIYDGLTNEPITLTNNKYEYNRKTNFYIKGYTEDIENIEKQVSSKNGYVEIKGKTTNGVPGQLDSTHVPPAAFSASVCDIYHGKDENYKNIIAPFTCKGLSGLKNITIGEGYEFIGNSSFGNGSASYKIENIKLPSTLKGIGSNAFMNLIGKHKDSDGNEKNVNMNLPSSLIYIGEEAFFGCQGVGNEIDLENLEFLGKYSFYNTSITGAYLHDKLQHVGEGWCYDTYTITKLIVDCDLYALTNAGDSTPYLSINIDTQIFMQTMTKGQTWDKIVYTEKSVTEPCNNFSKPAFWFNLRANEVDLSECKWANIGEGCFQGCNIKTLKLPKNLKTIKRTAFINATVENEIDMPDTIERIEEGAFLNANLTTDQLPTSLTYIGNNAFASCAICKNPTIPKGVTHIGGGAFMDNFGNENIEYGTVTIDCNLPEDVLNTCVGDLFRNTKINEMIFTENVTELPMEKSGSSDEFRDLEVRKVRFDGLKTLTPKAFIDSTSLETVDFSKDKNLVAIKNHAFYNCESLSELLLPENNQNTINIGEQAFVNTGFVSLGRKDSGMDFSKCSLVFEKPGYTFGQCQKLKDLYIPNGFNNNSVIQFMFYECPSLERVEVDYQIENIEYEAFYDCPKLKDIFIWGNTNIEGIYTESEEVFREVVIDKDNSVQLSESSVKGSSTEIIPIIIQNNSKLENFDVTIYDSLNGQKTINKSEFNENNTYTYNVNSSNKEFSIKASSNDVSVTFTSEVVDGKTYIMIKLTDDLFFKNTIPTGTNIYAYSGTKANEWDEYFASMRRNANLGFNAQFYPFDEVLYLTSNKPTIEVTAGASDFDKSKLTVYGLRRDGIVVETKDFKELSNYYKKESSTVKFDTTTKDTGNNTERDVKIYDTIVPLESVPVTSTNFKSLVTDYDGTNTKAGDRNVKISYTDGPTKNILNTDITVNVKGTAKPRNVTVQGKLQYKDGTPIANKLLRLLKSTDVNVENSLSTYTNEEGKYKFENVSSGNYTLQIKDVKTNQDTGKNEEVTLASCDISIKEMDETGVKDNIDVKESGEYEINTNIEQDTFDISGLINLESNKYTVTFIDWDNKVISYTEVEEGKSATKPEDPTREGYNFKGWTEKDSEEVVNTEEKLSKITSDLTLYAKYEKKVYTVTFKDYDGKILKEEKVKHAEKANPPEDPTRDGYTFKGWSADYTEVKSDLVIVAEYNKNATPQPDKKENTVVTVGKKDTTTANKVLAYCGSGAVIFVLMIVSIVNMIYAKIVYDKNKKDQ